MSSEPAVINISYGVSPSPTRKNVLLRKLSRGESAEDDKTRYRASVNCALNSPKLVARFGAPADVFTSKHVCGKGLVAANVSAEEPSKLSLIFRRESKKDSCSLSKSDIAKLKKDFQEAKNQHHASKERLSFEETSNNKASTQNVNKKTKESSKSNKSNSKEHQNGKHLSSSSTKSVKEQLKKNTQQKEHQAQSKKDVDSKKNGLIETTKKHGDRKGSKATKCKQCELLKEERDTATEEWGNACQKNEDLLHELELLFQCTEQLEEENTHMHKEADEIKFRFGKEQQSREDHIEFLQIYLKEVKEQLASANEERGKLQLENEATLEQYYKCKSGLVAQQLRQQSPCNESMTSSTYMTSCSMSSDTICDDGRTTENGDDECFLEDISTSTESINGPTYAEIAVCIDALDTRFEIKLATAIEPPKVFVNYVTPFAQTKWNIRKYDRVLSVNGISVHNYNKRTVEKMIKEKGTRTTTSLVLLREVNEEGNVDLVYHKNRNPLQDVEFHVRVKSKASQHCSLLPGDVIEQVASENISDLLKEMIKKRAKKSYDHVKLKVNRGQNVKRSTTTTEQTPLAPLTREFSSVKLRRKPFRFPKQFHQSLTRAKRSAASRKKSVPAAEFTTSSRESVYTSSCDNYLNLPAEKSTPLSSHLHSLFQNKQSLDKKDSFRTSEQLKRPNSCSVLPSPTSESVPSISNVKSSDHLRLSSPHLSVSLNDEDFITPPNIDTPNRTRIELQTTNITSNSTLNASTKTSNETLEALTVEAVESTPPVDQLSIDEGLQMSCTTNSNDVIADNDSEKKPSLPKLSYSSYKPEKECAEGESRVVRMSKCEHEELGIEFEGGNVVGIIVTRVKQNTVASNNDIRRGDRILRFNSYEFSSLSLDEATRKFYMLKNNSFFRIELQYLPDFEELLAKTIHDSLFVRCIRDYLPENKDDVINDVMGFSKGDLFHVTNTRFNFDEGAYTWAWFGTRLESELKREQGVMPRSGSKMGFEIENRNSTRRKERITRKTVFPCGRRKRKDSFTQKEEDYLYYDVITRGNFEDIFEEKINNN